MTFQQFMQRQLKIMGFMRKRYNLDPMDWADKYSARYRTRIELRFGKIQPS